MGLQSLRDKLLQAGIVTEEQARRSEADQAAARSPCGVALWNSPILG